MGLRGQRAANFQGGAQMLGAGLGELLRRKKQKRTLLEALTAMNPQVTQPVESAGQRNLFNAMVSGSLPPGPGSTTSYAPEQRARMGAIAGGQLGVIGDQTKGKMAQQAQLQRMVESGDPQLIEIAKKVMLKQSGMIQPEPLRGAQRYMNLGEGKVMDMETQNIMDYGDSPFADPDTRFKTVESGGTKVVLDYLPTLDGKPPEAIWQGKPEQKIEFKTVGAPGDNKQVMAYTTENGKIVAEEAKGTPISGVQKQELTTFEGAPLGGDKTYTRQMATAIAADQDAIVRSKKILENFDPMYQTVWGKTAKWGLGWVDKLAPLPDGEAKSTLQNLARFQRNTNENMNLYIKMITGAQMSEAEATRLSLAIANLEDSPAVFEAKLRDSITVLEGAAKKKQEELEYYAGVPGIDYKKAEEYAEAAAAKAVRLGMSEIGVDWSEGAAKEWKDTSAGGWQPKAPAGYKAVRTATGWEIVKE